MNLTEYMLLSLIQLTHLQLSQTPQKTEADKIFNDLVDKVNEKQSETDDPTTPKKRFFRGTK